MAPVNARNMPGKRPAAPVRLEEIPADWQCSWSLHMTRSETGEVVSRYWELKFINAACPEHGHLAAAA